MLFRRYRRELRRRSPRVLRLWGTSVTRSLAYAAVSTIILDRIPWGAVFFIPKDDLQIVLWEGSQDLQGVAAKCVLAEAFSLPDEFFGDIGPSATFGELVDRVEDSVFA